MLLLSAHDGNVHIQKEKAGRPEITIRTTIRTTPEKKTMTRFMRELNGELGDFWRRHAEEELEKVRTDFESGKITIGEDGVARNCIGRVLMDDTLEKLTLITDQVDEQATRRARQREVIKSFRAYKRRHKTTEVEKEELDFSEEYVKLLMVVDIITGEKIRL